MTPSLPHLSGLMIYYAQDLTICERLLRLFRDYAEQFIAMLNRDQCLALFTASVDLLKSYSAHHCASRVIHRTSTSTHADLEEEQNYSDVLWDRLEPAGAALLPLAAVDVNKFVAVVNSLAQNRFYNCRIRQDADGQKKSLVYFNTIKILYHELLFTPKDSFIKL
jgi:hypothetical protein